MISIEFEPQHHTVAPSVSLQTRYHVKVRIEGTPKQPKDLILSPYDRKSREPMKLCSKDKKDHKTVMFMSKKEFGDKDVKAVVTFYCKGTSEGGCQSKKPAEAYLYGVVTFTDGSQISGVSDRFSIVCNRRQSKMKGPGELMFIHETPSRVNTKRSLSHERNCLASSDSSSLTGSSQQSPSSSHSPRMLSDEISKTLKVSSFPGPMVKNSPSVFHGVSRSSPPSFLKPIVMASTANYPSSTHSFNQPPPTFIFSPPSPPSIKPDPSSTCGEPLQKRSRSGLVSSLPSLPVMPKPPITPSLSLPSSPHEQTTPIVPPLSLPLTSTPTSNNTPLPTPPSSRDLLGLPPEELLDNEDLEELLRQDFYSFPENESYIPPHFPAPPEELPIPSPLSPSDPLFDSFLPETPLSLEDPPSIEYPPSIESPHAVESPQVLDTPLLQSPQLHYYTQATPNDYPPYIQISSTSLSCPMFVHPEAAAYLYHPHYPFTTPNLTTPPHLAFLTKPLFYK